MENTPYQPPTSRMTGDRPLGEAAHEQVHRAASLVKDRATSAVEQRKEQAAMEVDKVIGALRQTGDALQRNQADSVGRLVSRAADGLERVGGYIQKTDVNTMLRDVQTLGRRHPAALVGGALLAGILLGRLLKASSKEDELDVVFEPDSALLEDRSTSSSYTGGLA